MTSEEQRIAINKKILKTTEIFINTRCSIEEISKLTGYSTSAIQRYLKDERIKGLFGEEIYYQIQEMMKIRRHETQVKGGVISSRNNIALKDEDGKFSGSKKR